MIETIFAAKHGIRMTSGLLFAATAAILLLPSHQSAPQVKQRLSLAPPKEVTPEIIASRGCIEGVDHPSEIPLTSADQLNACNDFVRNEEHATSAIYFRGLHLLENGTTYAHRDQAFRDLTAVIEADYYSPWAYSNRAFLHMRYRDAPEAALEDINTAIEQTADKPRSYFYRRRAYIFLKIAESDEDEAKVYAALDDLRLALELKPNDRKAVELKKWATQFLGSLHQKTGRPIQRG